MGVYSESGALRISVGDTSGKGRYASDGSVRATIVTGTSYTGLYAPDGSLNIVAEDGKLYHPCGAVRGIPSVGLPGLHTPSGAFYLQGLNLITDAILTEAGDKITQEDTKYLLLDIV